MESIMGRQRELEFRIPPLDLPGLEQPEYLLPAIRWIHPYGYLRDPKTFSPHKCHILAFIAAMIHLRGDTYTHHKRLGVLVTHSTHDVGLTEIFGHTQPARSEDVYPNLDFNLRENIKGHLRI